jgi:hypothetical protein
MADNPGTPPAGSEPAEPQPTATPGDQRPRPKYGELAPEGWTWSPPPGARPPGDITPVDGAQARSVPPHQASAPAPGQQYLGNTGEKKHGTAPGWDRPVTLGLLLLGLIGVFSTVVILGAVPEAIQMLYTQEKLGTYTPAAGVAGLLVAGKLTQGALWIGTAALSIFVTRQHRRAFYLPLIGGVVSLVAMFIFLSVILATDPTLMNFYGGK